MISYKLDNRKIFVVTFEGKITLNEVTDYLKEFKTINYLPDDLILLYDFKKASLIFSTEQIKIIAELADEVTADYKSIKTAFYVDEPLITAYSYLFSGMGEKTNKKRQVFST